MNPPKKSWSSFSIRTLLILITLVGIGIAAKIQWDHRQKMNLLTGWIDRCEQALQKDWYQGVQCSVDMPSAEQIKILTYGTLHSKTIRQRTICLKLLFENFADESLSALTKIAFHGQDLEMRCHAIHLLALLRDDKTALKLEVYLNANADLDPQLRTAIIDCIGLTRAPSHEISNSDALLDSDPPIEISNYLYDAQVREVEKLINVNRADRKIQVEALQHFPIQSNFRWYNSLPESTRTTLEQAMLAGDSSLEREAAARAIVAWPPDDYQLRFAEWGVWINVDGEFTLAEQILDEIPPFVHQTNNDLSSFEDRMTIPTIVTKPIIHLTANRPMSVDLEVLISGGKPWFAYPKPDDFRVQFGVSPVNRQEPVAKVDGFNDAREGYPWLLPKSRQHTDYRLWTGDRTSKLTGDVGLRWQSVIVSPEQLDWMKEPQVPDDERYRWWSELRKVPSSWVSSRGESERFLYYDGPTLATAPIDIYWDGEEIFCRARFFERKYRLLRLKKTVGDEPRYDVKKFIDELDTIGFPRQSMEYSLIAIETQKEQPRPGIFIRREDDQIWASVVESHAPNSEFVIEDLNRIEGVENVRSAFRQLIVDAGLTAEEAEGLVSSWTPAFFETNGQRFVYLLYPYEYDMLCPMGIRPEPTEIVRVGLVLTELVH